ncbi:hypothetical protein EV580_1494 [Mycobacterium sp. BK086]|uniref:PRC-barrel domain-containing protein n=1 Tax=Mycobacterium sp. BK086 TaxID=2512165 RepID=UPI001061DB9D|nr:PRC-barrel domain-containing protein [Mycobacterium sp. BK086]TDO18308.1 hypothetical protein EV580_1494 [Mycobacterium sp. BK086]
MQLSDLLELPVVDTSGNQVGTVIDVRLCVPGTVDDHPGSPSVFGIIVSPHTRSSYLGYERRRVTQPRLLAALLRWRHRGTFLAVWDDVADVTDNRIQLTSEATKYSPLLADG